MLGISMFLIMHCLVKDEVELNNGNFAKPLRYFFTYR